MEPFIIIAIFSLLAVFIIRKFVKDKKRTNQVFDTSLPSNAAISLNERSLYYYQEEFGNEQLPKYGGDLEFQPSSENIPLQILNSEFIDTTATPEQSNVEESQVSTGQNINQGETLNEIQQNRNTDSNVIADSSIPAPLSSKEQPVNANQS